MSGLLGYYRPGVGGAIIAARLRQSARARSPSIIADRSYEHHDHAVRATASQRHATPALPRLIQKLEPRSRLILALYWIAMVVGSHTPQLDVGSDRLPTVVQPDKALHVLAYAGLVILMVWARLFGRRRSLAITAIGSAVLAAAYGLTDEYTQEWFGRQFSHGDIVATMIGVLGGYLLSISPVIAPRRLSWLVFAVRCVWMLVAPSLVMVTLLPAGNHTLAHLVKPFMRPYYGMDKDSHYWVATVVTLLLAVTYPAGRARPKLSAALVVLMMGLAAPLVELTQKQISDVRFVELADVYAHNLGFLTGLSIWAGLAALWSLIFGTARPEPRGQRVTLDVITDRGQPAHFVGHAVVVGALTLVSRATGLVRDGVLAAAFGLGSVADAFFIGFLVPNLFRRLFGEGALSAAFIPQYTRLIERDPAIARRFAWLVVAALLIVLSAITLIGELILASTLHAGGWHEETALAIRLSMLMLPYMPLICLVALVGAMLQVHHRFGPPAAAPVVLNLMMIGFAFGGMSVYRGAESMRQIAVTVAIGVLAAGVAQLFWQVRALWEHTRPTLNFTETAQSMRAMLAMMAPMLIGLAVFQINVFLDSVIAFTLSSKAGGPETLTLFGKQLAYPVEPGGVAALQWAQRLYQFPLGVFGIAIATAIFPALSRAASDDLPDHFRTILHHGLRLTLFIGLPATVGLIFVREPLTRVIFERGAFTPQDTARVAWVLVGYASAVWAYSMTHVLTRACYAKQDAKTPLKISLINVALNLTLNLILIWPLGVAGLAWSTAICAAIQTAALLVAVRKHVDRPVDASVLSGWWQTAGLTLVMGTALWTAMHWIDPMPGSLWSTAGVLALLVAIGAGVYLGGALLFRMDELAWLLRRSANGSTSQE